MINFTLETREKFIKVEEEKPYNRNGINGIHFGRKSPLNYTYSFL